jgi:hypothetical protein
MMKVTVEIAEVHKSSREIEVPDDATPAEIRELAERDAGDADELDLEYSHTLSADHWTIRKENGEFIA